ERARGRRARQWAWFQARPWDGIPFEKMWCVRRPRDGAVHCAIPAILPAAARGNEVARQAIRWWRDRSNHHWVLTLVCADRPGIVHAISGAIVDAGGNITESQQFASLDTGTFFMRLQV